MVPFRDMNQWCMVIGYLWLFCYVPDMVIIHSMSVFHLLALKLAVTTPPTNLPLFYMFCANQQSVILPQGWVEALLTVVKWWNPPGSCYSDIQWVCSVLMVCCFPYLFHSFHDPSTFLGFFPHSTNAVIHSATTFHVLPINNEFLAQGACGGGSCIIGVW